MKLTIDNLDGRGAVDYTAIVTDTGPITLHRKLNAPSLCGAQILVGADNLPLPVRRARMEVTTDDGATILFTGYLATEPVREYAGEASEGPVYRARLNAVSDEWLLDKLGSGASRGDGLNLGLDGGALVARLAERVQNGGDTITVSTSDTIPQAGPFVSRPAAPWSVNAGGAADSTYAAYRALSDTVMVHSAAATTHALSDADGTLAVSQLALGNVRELANDITVSGEEEPAAFVQECFLGDGTTTEFTLSEAAFRGSNRMLITDNFDTPTIDLQQWIGSDPGSFVSLTSAGLTLNGGTGAEGVTTLTALDGIEMAGSVVAELGSVTLGAASEGMLAGFYEGEPILAACFAGFRVKQSSGVTTLVPVLNGAEVGTGFTPLAGHKYTLRLRLHCVEIQRVMQRYYSMVDGVVEGFGNLSDVAAPMDVVFELVDEGAASNTPATVLYDSFAAGTPLPAAGGNATPAVCMFVAVTAAQIFGSIGSVSVTRQGSLWVESVLSGGAQATRLIGSAGQGVDCEVSYGTTAGEPGKVTFFAGRVPAANERVVVSYRSSGRSIARIEDAASIAAEAAGGAQGTARWLGKVLAPIARSSADCESAAEAILAFATSRAAAIAGTYTCVNPAADIWPGDVLAIASAGVTTSVLVRSVDVTDEHAVPEVRRYKIAFANDWATEWADGLGLKLSEEIAADALLPQTASDGPPEFLANLQQLSVTDLTSTALQLDTGTAPPAGGGFEVRRRDADFGTSGADLVLRSPVRIFSIPRAAQVEKLFVRQYDASTPPIFSKWSSAIFLNAPVS